MGGELGVETEAGRGSTFTCTLALEARAEAGAVPALAGRRALVVRSDAAALEALVEGLTDLGLAVCAASMLQRPGKPDLLAAVVAMVLKSTPDEVVAIEAAVAIGDLAEVSRRAHKLKGSSRTVGARHVGDILASIEDTAKSSAPASLGPLLAELGDAHAAALRELAATTAARAKEESDAA